LVLVTGLAILGNTCERETDSVARALRYLELTQVAGPVEKDVAITVGQDAPGNWPQYVYLDSVPGIRFREISPRIPAYIHHALSAIHDDSIKALGLLPEHADTARTLRRRGLAFMLEFASRPGGPGEGTYGFWPYDIDPNRSPTPFERLTIALFGGPYFNGDREPANLRFFPKEHGATDNADDTALVYGAVLDDMRLDGGPGAAYAIDRFFSDWRDLGQANRWLNPSWLPEASGAYLTYFNYAIAPDVGTTNDVDFVINANVLYVLGCYGLADTPGVAKTAAWINAIVERGNHHQNPNELSAYYPDNYVFEYCVSRAYFEGGIAELEPAVVQLAEEIENAVLVKEPGQTYWDKGAPHLNTALALLVLMNAGRGDHLLPSSIAYLESEQDDAHGNWGEAPFLRGGVENGASFLWASPASTTALGMESICQYRLRYANR
jgi:hypothetical protein